VVPTPKALQLWHFRKPKERRSRRQRWRDAVAELVAIQADCQAWLDSLPETLTHSAAADALRAVCELDLGGLEVVEPPRATGGIKLVGRHRRRPSALRLGQHLVQRHRAVPRHRRWRHVLSTGNCSTWGDHGLSA